MTEFTKPQKRALEILATKPVGTEWTSSMFAIKMWPDKFKQRINGPWGLGPDAGPMHAGKMLTRLERMGLVRSVDHDGYCTYRLLRPAPVETQEKGDQ